MTEASPEIPVRANRITVHSLAWLRGIAALMVCVFHIKKYIWAGQSPNLFTTAFEQGYLGVYVFFVVSGFVIPFSMQQSGYRLAYFFRFLLKRLVRIQPPFIIMLLLYFIWTYGLYQLKGWGKPVLFDLKTFILNITYLVPFFKGQWVVIIFWTLAIEFQFYLLTGLVFDLLRKNCRWKYGLFIAITATGWLIPASYATVFHNAIYFIIGYLLFEGFTGLIRRTELFVALSVCLLYCWWIFPAGAIAAAATSLLIYLLNYRSRIAGFFGDISYSIYLSHGLACGATALFTTGMDPWWRFTLCMAVGITFAALFYRSVEKICLQQSKKIRYR